MRWRCPGGLRRFELFLGWLGDGVAMVCLGLIVMMVDLDGEVKLRR